MDCRVCSAPATGFHYKVTTCRACSAFFRRTCQLKLRYNCNRNGDCAVGQENRFSCRHCRMKKCLAVGMSLEDGDTPTDIYFTDPAQATVSNLPKFEHEFFTPENVFGNNETFSRLLKEKICNALNKPFSCPEDISNAFILNQADRFYKLHNEYWPCTKETVIQNSVVDMNLMWIQLYKEILILAGALSEIRPFADLPFDQKAILFLNFAMEFMQLDRTFVLVNLFGDDRDDQRLLTIGGQIYNITDKFDLTMVTDMEEDKFKGLMKSTEKYQMEEFTKPFKLLKPDKFEILYFMMASLWNLNELEGVSPETQLVAEAVMERATDELLLYYRHEKRLENTARRIYRVQNLLIGLKRVAKMRKQECSMSHLFDLFKVHTNFGDFTDYK